MRIFSGILLPCLVTASSVREDDTDVIPLDDSEAEALDFLIGILERTPPLVSEELMLLTALANNIECDLGSVLNAIQLDLPLSPITLADLSQLRDSILLGTSVPVWFHEKLIDLPPNSSMEDVSIIQEIMDSAPVEFENFKDFNFVKFVASRWWTLCISEARRIGVPVEALSYLSSGTGVFTLYPMIVQDLMNSLSMEEMAKLRAAAATLV